MDSGTARAQGLPDPVDGNGWAKCLTHRVSRLGSSRECHSIARFIAIKREQ